MGYLKILNHFSLMFANDSFSIIPFSLVREMR